MGFLTTAGAPLHWKTLSQHVERLKNEAVSQFIRLYRSFSTEQKDQLLFGDECEYMLIEFNADGDVTLCLDAHEILGSLHGLKDCVGEWSPEYARYMLEGSPCRPYNSLAAVICFERNMRLRRQSVAQCLGPRCHLVTLAVYPRLGKPPRPPCRSTIGLVVPMPLDSNASDSTFEPQDFRMPTVQGEPRALAESNKASRSFFASDDLVYPHPRFGALTNNIRCRRGRKVSIGVPLFMDARTDPSKILEADSHLPGVQPGRIPMDAQIFGMGCCGLQCTLQCAHLDEARYLYDQLVAVCAPMLALTAASPYFRGLLADTDCRFNTIAQSVDDRTQEETERFPTSRYGPSLLYISQHCAPRNDVAVPVYEPAVAGCLQAGIDEAFSRYIGSVLARDPLVVYENSLNLDPSTHVAHFQTIASANWTTVRLKIPAQPGDSWRVEFRPMEMQLTDFENAAFVAFIVLLSRAVLAFHIDLTVPISLTMQNLQRAQSRDAVLNEKFFIPRYTCRFPPPAEIGTTVPRPHCPCYPDPAAHPVVELTCDQIINGTSDQFPGLMTMINRYLDSIELDVPCRTHINEYLRFVSDKAAGRIPTTASWLRNYVVSHPAYAHDSVVGQPIVRDLMETVVHLIDDGPNANAGPLSSLVGSDRISLVRQIPPSPAPHPHTGILSAIS